jgi:hypothetical protein
LVSGNVFRVGAVDPDCIAAHWLATVPRNAGASGTSETCLHQAILVTTIHVDKISIVTFLAVDFPAIAADCCTICGDASSTALIANLDLACVAATVARDQIVVVALLRAHPVTIATNACADVRQGVESLLTLPASLHLAIVVATIQLIDIAIVACLPRLSYAIPTSRFRTLVLFERVFHANALAELADATSPTSSYLAIWLTTISLRQISIIAFLRGEHEAITTKRITHRGRVVEAIDVRLAFPMFLCLASRVTPVTLTEIAIVTNLVLQALVVATKLHAC